MNFEDYKVGQVCIYEGIDGDIVLYRVLLIENYPTYGAELGFVQVVVLGANVARYVVGKTVKLREIALAIPASEVFDGDVNLWMAIYNK